MTVGRYCFTATYLDTGTPPDYPVPASDSSTTECFVIAPPHLTITKTADQPSTVSAGGSIGFTVNLASDGQSPASGVEINDPLPGGSGTPTPTPVHWSIASQSGASPVCTLTGADGSQVLHCGPQSLAVGSSISVHLTATTSFAACGQYDNTATFTSTDAGTGQASASATCLKPNLVLTKTADHLAPVNAGEQIGFVVTLHNDGPGTATGAAINDPLPGGTSGTVTWSESPDSADCSIAGAAGSQLLTCGPKTLASGEEIAVHVVATTSAANCGVYNNTATFTTTNDGSGHGVGVGVLSAAEPGADEDGGSSGAGQRRRADRVHGHLAQQRAGDGDRGGDQRSAARGTVGTVTWSESPDNPDCSIAGAPGSQVLACGPKTLASGEEIAVHVTATTSAANCGVYNNTATFTTTNDGYGYRERAGGLSAVAPGADEDGGSQAPVNAGEQIGFTITLHNNGPGRATGAAINDPLPGGTSGTVTWSESPDNAGLLDQRSRGSQVLTCGPKTLPRARRSRCT